MRFLDFFKSKQMPSIPKMENYTVETRNKKLQVGDRIIVINNNYSNERIYRGYGGVILKTYSDGFCKVLFTTSDPNDFKEENDYYEAAVFKIPETDLIRVYDKPIADFPDSSA